MVLIKLTASSNEVFSKTPLAIQQTGRSFIAINLIYGKTLRLIHYKFKIPKSNKVDTISKDSIYHFYSISIIS